MEDLRQSGGRWQRGREKDGGRSGGEEQRVRQTRAAGAPNRKACDDRSEEAIELEDCVGEGSPAKGRISGA